MTSRTRFRRSITGHQRLAADGRGLRARRGAIVALVAVLLVAMVGLFAIAVDFGRLDNLKAELQTSADAAALAGAVELIPVGSHNPLQAANAATLWVAKNPAMQAPVTVVSSECGSWSDTGAPAWTAEVCGTVNANAVRVSVSRQSSGLFMSAFGITPPTLVVKATAAVSPERLPFPPLPGCLPTSCRVFLVMTP